MVLSRWTCHRRPWLASQLTHSAGVLCCPPPVLAQWGRPWLLCVPWCLSVPSLEASWAQHPLRRLQAGVEQSGQTPVCGLGEKQTWALAAIKGTLWLLAPQCPKKGVAASRRPHDVTITLVAPDCSKPVLGQGSCLRTLNLLLRSWGLAARSRPAGSLLENQG